VLGGPDASVSLGDRVALVARQIEGRSELAALVATAEAAAKTLAVLDGLEVALGDRAVVLDAFRRALIATRDRWLALEREFPTAALAALHVDHPRARGLLGHTIVPDTGGLHPAYAAVHRGKRPLFTWWTAAGGFDVPAPAPAPASTTTTSSTNPCDWVSGLDGCDLPCELVQCLDLASVADCDVGCL